MAIYEKGLIRTDRGLFLDKGNQAIDPRHPDFAGGAVGDGVHDDRPAIVAADAYATEISAGLVFGPGTYRVDTDLTIVNEIELMTGASFTGAGTVTYTERSGGSSATAFRPEDYGAEGDGVTDDYEAFQSMADAVNAAGGGIVELGANKTYYIGQFVFGGPSPNGIEDIKFSNCSAITIRGNGAKIDCKGDFNRDQDNDLGGGSWQSYAATVVPIYLENCDYARVENIELDGNVDQMTASAGVIEGHNYGVCVHDTNNFILENIYVHHFATDGIQLGPVAVVERGTLINCKSSFNARLGMSIIHARNITCIDCLFEETQNAAGTYGSHAPGSGVDIEPDSATVDDVTFLRCRFYNNGGGCFFSLSPGSVSNVACRDCTFDAGTSDAAITGQIIAGSNGVHFDNCALELGDGHVQVGDNTSGNLDLQWVTMRGGYVKSTGNGIVCDAVIKSLLEAVEIIGTWTTTSATLQPSLANNKMRVRNCRVFRPTASYNGGGSFQVATVWNVGESIGNQFETDLTVTTSEHFANNYGSGTLVRDDRFLPTTSNAFRPAFNSTWPAGRPYTNPTPFTLIGSGTLHTMSTQQDDFETDSGGTSGIVRLYPQATNVNITGFADGVEGRVVLLQQAGDLGNTVTLKHQSVSSTAGNRIATPSGADLVLADGEGVWVWYDDSSNVWRVTSK